MCKFYHSFCSRCVWYCSPNKIKLKNMNFRVILNSKVYNIVLLHNWFQLFLFPSGKYLGRCPNSMFCKWRKIVKWHHQKAHWIRQWTRHHSSMLASPVHAPVAKRDFVLRDSELRSSEYRDSVNGAFLPKRLRHYSPSCHLLYTTIASRNYHMSGLLVALT